jgi:hypothetical protein
MRLLLLLASANAKLYSATLLLQPQPLHDVRGYTEHIS